MARATIALGFILSLMSVRPGLAQQAKPLSKADAIAAAEKFVSAEGYTGPGKDVLLQPRALGARLDSGLWFVGFRAANLPIIRGVVINAQTGAARLASQNFQQDWLMAADTAASVSTATAKGASADKAKGKKPVGKKAKKPAAATPAPAAAPSR